MNTEASNSSKAADLADRILEGGNQLATFAERLTEEEWEVPVSGDGRSVGVVVHHVASTYPTEIKLALVLARGEAITDVTKEGIDAANAEHAAANKFVGRAETLAYLKSNCTQAAEAVRKLSDQELDNWALVSLYHNAPLTCQFFIEDHALRHSFHHLGKIKESF